MIPFRPVKIMKRYLLTLPHPTLSSITTFRTLLDADSNPGQG